MTDNSTSSQLPDHLISLGEALARAARADLESPAARPVGSLARLGSLPRRIIGRPRRRMAVGVAVAAVVVPAAAFAATQLITTGQVAASLPQGTLALMGTHPTCSVVTANVEYHCVLASAPKQDVAPKGWHARRTAIGTSPDGKQVLAEASSLPALKQELRAAHLIHVVIVEKGDGLVDRHGRVTAVPPTTTPPATDWRGAAEPTVDATKHVNGGCRGLNAAGTDWECYIGEAAVRQKLIGQGLLGAYAPDPGVG